MPQARSPEEPAASGIHCWLESGAVKWERKGEMRNEERRTKTEQGQSMKHTRRMVRREGTKNANESVASDHVTIKLLNSLGY